jgi:hypothetical protein
VRKVIPFGKIDAFDNELTRKLSEAFEMAWKGLCDNRHPATASWRAMATREIMARRIVHLARQGVTDRSRLSAEAITVILATDSRPQTKHTGENASRSKQPRPLYTGL